MSKRVIFHIDVNSAFLSWEAAYRIYHLGARTDLRNEVSAVGGDMAMRHGIIPARSIPAKKHGIQTGKSIVEAKAKCPFLKLVPPNYSLYEACSKAFLDILREYTPDVEQYSIDEALMDMRGTEKLFGDPFSTANTIRERIRDELGFTVNVGKEYGNSTTIAFDVTDASTARLVLLSPAETVGMRLRAAGVKAEVIAVGIRTFDLRCFSHQMTLYNATDITIEIHRYACRLSDSLWDGTPIRHLGIHTSRIRKDACTRQLDIFDNVDYEKPGKLDRTVDAVRIRYGKDSIRRAAFAGSRIDHVGGGISREKRTVDYTKIQVD